MSRKSVQPLRLVIALSGGVVHAVGYDQAGAPVALEVQVIDYDAPAGGVPIAIPQTDGEDIPAITYAVQAQWLPEQVPETMRRAQEATAAQQAADDAARAQYVATLAAPVAHIAAAADALPPEWMDWSGPLESDFDDAWIREAA
ncbi:hypothetical protein E4T66_18430 [Sinimarinibacterium sp. CAU 1509]|uniref:hypothetical protein n=1 Tax=Sinimarinibacterium sp. CAU 1509 TaxID=2562283 RepID=UPI0010AB773C|nr:hypothetical protein [Sinimarinibacterium sp. CAU 1509]TJY57384.1 hypothetical protein E4T66_18430 [Sinimarinibacterium sp. CAU 1509]